jgi:hypothetical protein
MASHGGMASHGKVSAQACCVVPLQTALKRWQQAKAADNVTILVVFFSYG